MKKHKLETIMATLLILLVNTLQSRAEPSKFICKIKKSQKQEAWRTTPMLDILYSEQVLIVDEEKKYVAIYQRVADYPYPLLWNYQNPSRWRDGDIIPEGQGVFGAGNGISYVRSIDGKIKFGVIWDGWPTYGLEFDKSTRVLHDTFVYQCSDSIEIDNRFK